MTAIMPKDEVQKLLDEVSDSRHWVKSGRALKKMQNAAPNFARSLIAAHDEIERLRAAPDDEKSLMLIDLIGELGREVYCLLDDCETSGPVGEEVHTITSEGLEKVSAILNRIEALPFEEPGYILGTGAMLQAAIKQTFVSRADAQATMADLDRLADRHARSLTIGAEVRADRDRLAADNARLAAQVEALTGALKEAGDYLQACKVNGLPDLGAASRMPFLDDVIANVDAALTLAAMTPAEQAAPPVAAPDEYEWNARYDAAWPAEPKG